jgi:hypothetical protein
MNVILDAWVQFAQIALLFILVTQNFGLRARLKAIEQKVADK